jgi:adenine-specific DNA-methyltransferase
MNPNKSFEKLKKKLAELFQLDQADLDFGIYRIMNERRDEINRFLESDLLPQVRKAFGEYKSSDKAEIQKELDKVVDGVKVAGMDPEQAPKVKELRARLAEEAVDVTALENEVYDHLCRFFSRYYDEGDFISLRRYKEGVYAIPYEGEEVKLHWANHDQYYIKTTEYFRDYAFKTPSDHRVHFKITEADTEKDNIKAANGNDRRFLLHGDKPVIEENGELVVRFEYRPDGEKRRQDAINADTARRVIADLNDEKLAAWKDRLAVMWKRAGGKESDKTILDKHLFDYTRRNTFDYFIHKDLEGFLRCELDFYIKNEVMRLDDIEEESALRVEQYLSKIKVIRRIAHKIIDFLAQIENFQKKLWLKKKFVIETNYCLTLDRVPGEMYPEIADNNAQRQEWVHLFAVDEIRKDLIGAVDYSEPLTVDFLKANPFLMLDTRFFGQEFKDKLLASMDDVETQCDGLLVRSENFQALYLLQEGYRQQVKCIYIDPPYNANSSEIIYKNNYKHSSWLSLIDNRLSASKPLLTKDFVNVTAIDEVEQEVLGRLLSEQFIGCEKSCISIVHNATGQQGANFSYTHEFAYFVFPYPGKFIGFKNREENPDIRPLRNVSKGAHLRSDAANCFYPIFIKNSKIIEFGDVCPDDFHPEGINVLHKDGAIAVYPIDPQGVERKWVFARDTVETILDELEAQYNDKKNQWDIIRTKKCFNFKTVWTGSKYSANSYGSRILNEILPSNPFTFPKSIFTVRDCIDAAMNNQKSGLVLDYFAGSGTTGHAVINLNREDGGNRKYILVEMGEHFDSVLKPRIRKVVYSKDWKNGKPISREGVSHMFKYIRLESYEDALANIKLQRTGPQQLLIDKAGDFRESYMLKYLLDVESRGSQTLLNIGNFDDPWNYKLFVGAGSVGETMPVNVDLVETFNWLLGLKVKHVDRISGFQVVEGENPKGEKVLVIWRKVRDLDETDPQKIATAREQANRDLEVFFRKQQYNTLGSEFDVIYVNGDNNLMNVPLEPDKEGVEPRYKVRLIEEEFKRLMFDVKEI